VIAGNGTASSSRSPSVSAPGPTLPLTSPLDRRSSLTSAETPANGGATETRSFKTDAVRFTSTSDKTRDKCLEMTYDALVLDSGAPAELIVSRAKAIEATCHREFGGDYRNKIRRLILNLKDKNNPSLRQAIVSGDLVVERFCQMTNQEMASEERKQANELLDAQNLHNSLAAPEQEAETDAFQCGRCKQRKTRYRQAQTRSADEPMTTFVTCTNCGNRWKFS